MPLEQRFNGSLKIKWHLSHKAGCNIEGHSILTLMNGINLRKITLGYAFFTNSDFNCIAPNPSILQSMS